MVSKDMNHMRLEILNVRSLEQVGYAEDQEFPIPIKSEFILKIPRLEGRYSFCIRIVSQF